MKHLICFLLLTTLFTGCNTDNTSKAVEVDTGPQVLGVGECNACGMVVRDQPSPRAQGVHRDGTRAWFCSLGDMMVYLDTPSPHGLVNHIYVEDMPANFKSTDMNTEPLSWLSTSQAYYVLGVERPAIMGLAVLSFKDREAAEEVAGANSGRVLDWSGLREVFGKGAE